MSGEMCTSLGNGFTNLMCFLYLCKQNGVEFVDGVVEGDDGLFAVRGKVPSPAQFNNLGLIIKMETHDHLNEASFCGLVFDPDDLSNVADPAELLCKFGWTHSVQMRAGPKKLKSLLKAKAYSLAYELPRCPIANALARYALRVTSSSKPLWSAVDKWKLQCRIPTAGVLERLALGVPACNRVLVARVYGIDVPTQLVIEGYLDSLTDIQQLQHPLIYALMKPVWRLTDMRYVVTFAPGQKEVWL
jgi:hypothetical protein